MLSSLVSLLGSQSRQTCGPVLKGSDGWVGFLRQTVESPVLRTGDNCCILQLMLTQISAERLPVEQFRTDLHRICGEFDARPGDVRPTLRGALHLETRAGLEMAHVAADIQQIVRTRQHVRRDDGENYFLVIQEEGRALMSQNDEVRMISPGDMILIDSAQPSDFTFFSTFSRQLSLHLPRVEMWARFGNNVRGGLFVPRSDHTAIAICAVISKAFSPSSSEAQSGYLNEALFGLIGAMLYGRVHTPGSTPIEADVAGAENLKRGMAYIDNRYADPELTIATIAEDLSVSVRQLQRGFTLIGTTPTSYLLQKRLEQACAHLSIRNTRRPDILISTIAMDCGFSDVSYFNRLFRKAFGCAPGQYATVER
jgi:AraC family transcriptional activator of tynA and feaB